MNNVPRRIYHIDFISVSGETEIITDQLDKMNINDECLDVDIQSWFQPVDWLQSIHEFHDKKDLLSSSSSELSN